jgi:hypothetical protein
MLNQSINQTTWLAKAPDLYLPDNRQQKRPSELIFRRRKNWRLGLTGR